MKLAIMQPYFFPYIGYFQLISEVDKYILYDNLNYIKEGWVNKNRILVPNQKDTYIIVPVKNKSSNKKIKDIEIDDTKPWRKKMINTLNLCYRKSKYYDQLIHCLEGIINSEYQFLSDFNKSSIFKICSLLNIEHKLEIESEKYYFVEDIIKEKMNTEDFNIHLEDKVLRIFEICEKEKADAFINAIGGTSIYSKIDFLNQGINLSFLNTQDVQYEQRSQSFYSNLSIIDVLMNCGIEYTRDVLLKKYQLI